MPTKIANLKKALLVMHSPIDKIVGIENAQKIYEYANTQKALSPLIKQTTYLSILLQIVNM